MSENIKRRLPKVVITAIEPIIEKYRSTIALKTSSNILLQIVDNKDDSFYFSLRKRENTVSGIRNIIELVPLDDRLNKWETTATEEQLISLLTNWCERIKFYHRESVLDDPILNSYHKDIEEEMAKINLADEDANTHPFNISQQRFLIYSLNETYNLLEMSKFEIEEDDYQDINNEISNAKKSISKETKQQVLNRISRILAKCRKSSFEFGEKCVTSFFKALSSEAGKAVFKALAGYLTT